MSSKNVNGERRRKVSPNPSKCPYELFWKPERVKVWKFSIERRQGTPPFPNPLLKNVVKPRCLKWSGGLRCAGRLKADRERGKSESVSPFFVVLITRAKYYVRALFLFSLFSFLRRNLIMISDIYKAKWDNIHVILWQYSRDHMWHAWHSCHIW